MPARSTASFRSAKTISNVLFFLLRQLFPLPMVENSVAAKPKDHLADFCNRVLEVGVQLFGTSRWGKRYLQRLLVPFAFEVVFLRGSERLPPCFDLDGEGIPDHGIDAVCPGGDVRPHAVLAGLVADERGGTQFLTPLGRKILLGGCCAASRFAKRKPQRKQDQ